MLGFNSQMGFHVTTCYDGLADIRWQTLTLQMEGSSPPLDPRGVCHASPSVARQGESRGAILGRRSLRLDVSFRRNRLPPVGCLPPQRAEAIHRRTLRWTLRKKYRTSQFLPVLNEGLGLPYDGCCERPRPRQCGG